MTAIPRSHPRYRSLVVRAELARQARLGIVVPEGLVAHGRGEAFDYLIGERTTPSARRAAQMAARWLANAERPVVSVNGNVAALAAREVAGLARRWPRIGVEVNLFHRTAPRASAIAQRLRRAGAGEVLGVHPTVRVPGLPSDRGRVDARGIAVADVVLVPLEDGDRAEALRRWGRRVIAIDLNPLSRTARSAHIPIIDELTRALAEISKALPSATRRRRPGFFPRFDAAKALADARREIAGHLRSTRTWESSSPIRTGGRASRPPAPKIARRSGQTR